MKKILCSLFSLLIFLFSANAGIAQTGKTSIPAGTVIPVTLNGNANSDRLYAGDIIPVTIYEDVYVDGAKVFAAGATGIANVEKVVHSGGHGRAGEILVKEGRIRDIDNNNHNVQLNIASKGQSRRPSAIFLSVIGVCLILIPFGIWREGDPAVVSGSQVFNAVTITNSEPL